MNFIKTDSKNPDFIQLVKELDAYLKVTDGDAHSFYDQYNSIELLNNIIVAYDNQKPVACGAFKAYKNTKSVEIKRMYVVPAIRGKGAASALLKELEIWAQELSFTSCILETGKNQIEAIALYKKNNYRLITNYGPYVNIKDSFCFEKTFK